MSNRLYALPKNQPKRLSDVQITSSRRRTTRLFVSVFLGTMLIAAVLLLSACQPLPKTPCPEHKLPTLPALTLPTPKISYSINAANDTEVWRKMLTEQSQTVKP